LSVGRSLGVSEDAAQKRVSRALEKLRVLLGRRGVSLSAMSLGALLSTETLSAVPVNLAVTISSAALAHTAAASGFTLSVLKIMAMTQLKLGVAGIMVVGVAATIVMQQRTNAKLRAEVEALQQQVAEQARVESQRAVQPGPDSEEQQRLQAQQA